MKTRCPLPGAVCLALVLGLLGACAAPDPLPPLQQALEQRAARQEVPPPGNGAAVPAARGADLPVLDHTTDLDDYLLYAALQNPGLQAAYETWQAALERVPQVGALPDPRVTYRYYIQEVETRTGPMEQGVGLSQTFPWLGKLQSASDAASEAARAARQRFEGRKLELFFQVAQAYYEHYYLGRAIAVVHENVNLVRHLERVARARYRTAGGGHPEVIRAQVELERLEDQHDSLEDLVGPSTARLNALLNRPSAAAVPLPPSIPDERIAAEPGDVQRWMIDHNPELRALQHEIARAERTIQLARQEYFPDLSFGVEFTDIGSPPRPRAPGLASPIALAGLRNIAAGRGDFVDAYALGYSAAPGPEPGDAGTDAWMVSLSMNIPIWHHKYAAGMREARALHAAALYARTELQNQLALRIEQVLYAYRDAERKLALYGRTLVPKTRESLRATEASFRTGEASFGDLVDAERSLLEFELAYERARADRARRIAEIERLVGREIPCLPVTGTPPESDTENDPAEEPRS